MVIYQDSFNEINWSTDFYHKLNVFHLCYSGVTKQQEQVEDTSYICIFLFIVTFLLVKVPQTTGKLIPDPFSMSIFK